MRFSIYQQSQAGGRATNQDRMGYCFTRESLLLLLADGMGGHLHGELAATLTLQTMGSLFQKAASLVVADPEAFLDELIYSSHLALHRYRPQNRLDDTPRTTIVPVWCKRAKHNGRIAATPVCIGYVVAVYCRAPPITRM